MELPRRTREATAQRYPDLGALDSPRCPSTDLRESDLDPLGRTRIGCFLTIRPCLCPIESLGDTLTKDIQMSIGRSNPKEEKEFGVKE